MNGPNQPPTHQQYPQPPQPGNFAQRPNFGGENSANYRYAEPVANTPDGGRQMRFDANGQPVDPRTAGGQHGGLAGVPQQPGTFGQQYNQAAQTPPQQRYMGRLSPDQVVSPNMSDVEKDSALNSFLGLRMGQTAVMHLARFGNSRVTFRGRDADKENIYEVTPVAPALPVPSAQPRPPQPQSFGPQRPRTEAAQRVVPHAPAGNQQDSAASRRQQAVEEFDPVNSQPPVTRWERGAEDLAFADPFNAAKAANGGVVIGGGSQISRPFEAPKAADGLDLGFDQSPQQQANAAPEKEEVEDGFMGPAAPSQGVGAAAAAQAAAAQPRQTPTQERAPIAEEDPVAQFRAPEAPDILTQEVRPGHKRTTEYEQMYRPGGGGVIGGF